MYVLFAGDTSYDYRDYETLARLITCPRR
jgi:hypothetical protein